MQTEERNKIFIEKQLEEKGKIFSKKADALIDECATIPMSDGKEGGNRIEELMNTLNRLCSEYEKELRANSLYLTGPGGAGLNIHTLLVKTYRRASEHFRTKAVIMRVTRTR